jgi:hypothetical protein
VPEPPIPNPIRYADPNPALPGFTPEELGVLFDVRDSLIHGLSLPRKPGMALSLTFPEASGTHLLSALSKLLED